MEEWNEDSSSSTNSEPSVKFFRAATKVFGHENSDLFQRAKTVLALYAALQQSPCADIITSALESVTEATEPVASPISTSLTSYGVTDLFTLSELSAWFRIQPSGSARTTQHSLIEEVEEYRGITRWLCSTDQVRLGKEFWVDVSLGHNLLCALYLRFCGNKSVAVEHPWQEYLKTFGPHHLRHSSRGLRLLTTQIRKIDETANIKGNNRFFHQTFTC
jgi:hypothetical protein